MFNRLCEYVSESVKSIVDDRGSPCECTWKLATIGKETLLLINTESVVLHQLLHRFNRSLKSATGYRLTKRYMTSAVIADRNTVALWKSEDEDLYINDLYLDRSPFAVVAHDWESFSYFHKTSIISVETDGILHAYRI